MVAEIWKDIPEFVGSYQTSNLGRIKSLSRQVRAGGHQGGHPRITRERILKPWISKRVTGKVSALQVSLCKKGYIKAYLVHALVLSSFVGPRPEGKKCCHFPDKDPTNNKLENLRWDTKKANAADRVVHGTDPRTLNYYEKYLKGVNRWTGESCKKGMKPKKRRVS